MKKIYYGRAVYDKKEINAVLNVLKNDSLSLIDGKKVKTLEKKISQIFGKKYGLMVNSGSSANLLALSSFKFKKGSEIITPNLTFSTTVAPIYQLGLIPHFVGAEENKFLTEAEENGSINDLYSLANEQDKGDDFEKFIAKLPAGLPKAATIKHLLNLSNTDKQKFMKNGWEESTIPNTFTISDKFEIGLFNIDAKGIGKGEVYCCWRFRDSEIEGGTSSFDVTVGNTTYEVKDYSGPAAKEGKPEKENKKSIRVGKEGIVSKFPVWKTILRTVDMVKRIPEDKYELLPGASPDSPLHDKWQQLIKLRNYIIDRVSPKNLKIVTGEFNTTDTKSFKQF